LDEQNKSGVIHGRGLAFGNLTNEGQMWWVGLSWTLVWTLVSGRERRVPSRPITTGTTTTESRDHPVTRSGKGLAVLPRGNRGDAPADFTSTSIISPFVSVDEMKSTKSSVRDYQGSRGALGAVGLRGRARIPGVPFWIVSAAGPAGRCRRHVASRAAGRCAAQPSAARR